MKRIVIICSIIILAISCEKNEGVPDLIDVSTGATFKIEFEANWSTGYHWEWTNRESISVADTTDMEYIQDDPGIEGSPGTEIWRFEAKSKGDQTLIFKYLGPGSTGDENTQKEEIRVIVD